MADVSFGFLPFQLLFHLRRVGWGLVHHQDFAGRVLELRKGRQRLQQDFFAPVGGDDHGNGWGEI